MYIFLSNENFDERGSISLLFLIGLWLLLLAFIGTQQFIKKTQLQIATQSRLDICFRAALLRSRLTQQYIILGLVAVLGAHFLMTRAEIYALYGKLRTKEYILAPGVQDFTPAAVQSVPDSYVNDAVTEYLTQLGNVSAGNIEEQFKLVGDSMSPQLRVKFMAEAADLKAKIKSENIAELLTITDREVRSTGDGYYQATVLARRDTYVNNEYLGHVDEAIEMVLQLVPPRSGRRWFLQINSLSRQSAETFRVKKGL
jgi:hypothetical protein